MRLLPSVGALALAALLALPIPVEAQTTDHFTCYRAKNTSGTPAFSPVNVTFVDAFWNNAYEVRKPKLFCAPTNKNGEDPSAPSHPDHLEDYQVKPPVKFATVINQHVSNQFGTIVLDAKKPVALQVPTAKSLVATPPEPATPAVDHFTCYKARVRSGTPKFVRVTGVTLQDQFGSMTVDVLKPSRLCLPTNKNNEEPGAPSHPDSLLCYKVRQSSLPKFVKRIGLFTNNQFGAERVDAIKPKELCVPSSRSGNPVSTSTPNNTPTPTATATPPAGCGNGMLDGGEQCDGAINGACGGAPCTALCSCGCLVPMPLPDRLALVSRPGRDSDTGWTGLSHDLPGSNDGYFTAVRLSNCDTNPASPSCGTCDYDGPISFPGPAKNCFCLNLAARDSSSMAACDPEAPVCGLPGETCECIYGPPLPLTSGAISACVVNRVAEPLFGTINIADVGPHSGESAGFLHLEAGAHTAPTQDEACPQCLGDTTPRDGVKGGTCTYGGQVGEACDISGDHPLFGTLSFDCLPSAGANIGNLTILIPNQTTQTSTLSPGGIKCSAPGFTTQNCPCDTCATAAAEPCNANADCPGGAICGGKRCIGGSNSGQACTVNSSCPGGGCGRAGAATATNACDDTVCTPDPSDPASPNDGVCLTGPFDLFCSIDTFRGCASDAECNPPPAGNCDTCDPGQSCIGKLRECFLEPIIRVGTPGTKQSILATTFCIPPSQSAAVNAGPGVPGAGSALEPTRLYQVGPACGNGMIDSAEECDPPAGGSCAATCLPNCRCPSCGDGYHNQPSEECDGDDDANCPNVCQGDCTCEPAVCGDDVLQFGEECDGTAPGSQCPPAFCQQPNCTCAPYCGDNTVDPGEQCDGTGSVACPANACQANCTCGPFCGDGIVNGGEQCDGATTGSCPGTCEQDCTCSPFCGNNMSEAGELCDGTDDDACPDDCASDCTCPAIGELTFTVQNGADLDAGWAGLAHDFPWQTGAKIPGEIGSCDPVNDPVCTFLANVGSHCSGDASVSCTANGQCPIGQNCQINTFGPPLPLTASGIPACVVPVFREDITGTYNLLTGSTEYFLPITAVVYLGLDANKPCPTCNCASPPCDLGETGTCDGNPLQPCTVEGTGPLGATSTDCQPTGVDVSGGGLVLALDPATTGTSTFPSNQPCDASGFTNQGCWGDGQLQANQCATGCDGGSNNDLPCASDADCPGAPAGACKTLCRSIAGQTRPNQGVQAVGEAECVAGPFEADGARRCFLDPIVRVGTAGTTTNTTVGTLFVPATTSPLINQVAGIPGPAAIRFPMAVDARYCGDNVVNRPNEECDGTDSSNCPGACTIGCLCNTTCGNNMMEFGEQCDGTDSLACPGLCGAPGGATECTCPATCGDGFKAPAEVCDPGGVPPGTLPDDEACPGQCLPAVCTCPPPLCGNGMVEVGEVCELPQVNCGPLQLCLLCTGCIP